MLWEGEKKNEQLKNVLLVVLLLFLSYGQNTDCGIDRLKLLQKSKNHKLNVRTLEIVRTLLSAASFYYLTIFYSFCLFFSRSY